MSSRRLLFAVPLAALVANPLLAAKPQCGDNKCNGGETAESCPADCGGGGGGGGYISTCDTFRDDPADAVTSDGQGVAAGNSAAGEYCDAERHVSAIIGEANGGHHLDLERSARELDLDFSQCAAPPCTQLAGFNGSAQTVLSIENATDPGGVHLLGMLEGETDYVGLVIAFDNGRKNHVRLSFGRDTTVVACLGESGAPDSGDKVRVTRLDASTWEMESSATDRACLSEVRNNDWNNPVAHGFFNMPFLVTIEIHP